MTFPPWIRCFFRPATAQHLSLTPSEAVRIQLLQRYLLPWISNVIYSLNRCRLFMPTVLSSRLLYPWLVIAEQILVSIPMFAYFLRFRFLCELRQPTMWFRMCSEYGHLSKNCIVGTLGKNKELVNQNFSEVRRALYFYWTSCKPFDWVLALMAVSGQSMDRS